MKKVSLIIMGLAFAFFGFQSFVEDGAEQSDLTVLTIADENWSLDETEAVLGLPAWHPAACVTPAGLPGTICSWYVNGSPFCTIPAGTRPACKANL